MRKITLTVNDLTDIPEISDADTKIAINDGRGKIYEVFFKDGEFVKDNIWIEEGNGSEEGDVPDGLEQIAMLLTAKLLVDEITELDDIVYKMDGKSVSFRSIVPLMDKEIYELVKSKELPTNGLQSFADKYFELHLAKYGEEFAPLYGFDW